jgi:hypothetical protein
MASKVSATSVLQREESQKQPEEEKQLRSPPAGPESASCAHAWDAPVADHVLSLALGEELAHLGVIALSTTVGDQLSGRLSDARSNRAGAR